jgi:peroxiredoxin Q/BCP
MATKKKKTAQKPAKKKVAKKKAVAKKAPAKKSKKAAPKKSAKKTPATKKIVAKKPAKKAAAKKPAVKKAPAKAAPAKTTGPKAEKISYPAISVGSQVPTVTLQDQSGHDVDLGEKLLSSPTTVLYFYPKDDTPGCTKQACSFRDHMNNLQQDGVQIIGVSPDSPEDHRKFIEKYGLNFTLLSDPERKLINHFNLWRKKQYMGREYMGVERTTLLLKGDSVVHVWQPVSVDGHVEDVSGKIGALQA